MANQNSEVMVLPNSNAPIAVRLLYKLLSNCKVGTLHIKLGEEVYVLQAKTSGPDAQIEVHNPLQMIKRFSRHGELGFAESYMNGDWETSDLSTLLYWGALNLESLFHSLQSNFLIKWFNRLRHAFRHNSEQGSKRNISAHYDLGNDFYKLWLDPTMTYSSAVFLNKDEPLEQAQLRKYQHLLDSLDAKPGQHILEVGCGWGGFAEYAAERGFRITGITSSQEQLTWAQKRISDAGLSHLVELKLQDYRSLSDQFDHIVSIEMFEAVGERYWPGYFKMLYARLKPGGKVALQVITIDHKNFDYYRQNVDFIQLYIFPGGMLPSPEVFAEHADSAGLIINKATDYGHDYERTLQIWHQRFNEVVHHVEALGYDQRFINMWRYYLSYCEAGFRTEHTGVYQYLMSKPL
ncbi:MAG TPA: class I SAM-dependent methyltransferase [Methylophaga sp.]|nr:class I SAM-dependent methyltransferase [Methylophaga sp.]